MRLQFTGLWGNRDFLKMWAAETISNFGSMVSGAALSFTAILVLKATPAQLGLLMAANLMPKFLAGLVAGVWVDRLRRRPIMIFADMGRAILLATIPASALLHRLRIEQLYVVTVLTGLLTLCFDIANRSYLPTLVGPEELVEGNSKLTASGSIAEFSAFSLGGWLVQWFTGPIAVLIDALSFLWSALFLGLIVRPEPPPIPHEERESLPKELGDGLRTVQKNPLLSALTVSALLLGLSSGIIGTVIVAFMARDLGFKPGILGMIWAVGGLSSLLGSLVAERIARRFGIGPTLTAGLFFAGLGIVIVPLGHGATLLAGVLLVASQMICDPAYTIYNINEMSLRQTITPHRLQGRVNATLEFVKLGATLLGALLGGVLGVKIGLRATVFVGASVPFLASLWLWLSPLQRVQKMPPAVE